MEVPVPLAALAAAVPVGLILLDHAGRVMVLNPAAEALFDIRAQDTSNRDFRDLELSYRVPGLRSAVESVRQGGARERLGELVLPGGAAAVTVARVPQSGDATLIIAEGRDEVRALRACLHVTADQLRATGDLAEQADADRRVTSEELRASNEELNARVRELEDEREAGRHKDEFLAMLAHELRTPLGAIAGALQVMERRSDDPGAVRRAREVADRQVRHQARLLEDLLEVSRVARGKVRLRLAPTTLAAAVDAGLEMARARLEDRGHHHVEISRPREPVLLTADVERLGQVIGNLLDNAAKYTPQGGRIAVAARREGDRAIVCVRDTGVGIPGDMLGRIFDLFTQVEPSLARSEGGLGIGLALVRMLVEMHGGRVDARSDGPGRGSEFTVALPVAVPAALTRTPRTGRGG